MRHNAVILSILAVVMAGCQAYDEPHNPQPELTVADAVGITRTEAVLTGAISDNGGNGLPNLCFEWWQAGNTVFSSPVLSAGENEVEYLLKGLKPGSGYCFRLKGSNGRVEMVSETRQFETLPNVVPVISRLTPLAQGPASLIASFRIEDNGGEDIIEAGCNVRNVKSGNVTKHIADIADIAGLSDPSDESDTPGNTVYITMRGLEQNADLEITPYAVNAVGEAKGAILDITTGNAVSVSQPGMLAELLGGDRMDYTSLSFSGFMNGDDIRTLREMAGMDFYGKETDGSLVDINLTDVTFVEGGSNYIPSRNMKNDVVGYGMFQNLHKLKNVLLPNTVKTIEEQAFQDCSSLTSITVPAEVTAVTPSDGCTSLEEIKVSPANRSFKSVDGVLFDAGVTGILWFPIGRKGEYSLPAGVTAIGDYAFRNSRITHFTMNDNITRIGRAVFCGSSVQKVVVSDNLATIPQATFQSCTSLTEIRLGSATNLIGAFAFDGCPLADIWLPAAIPPVCSDETFSSSYELLKQCRLHVPESSISQYRRHPVWGKFENISK